MSLLLTEWSEFFYLRLQISKNIEFSFLTITKVIFQANFSIFALKTMFIHYFYQLIHLTSFNCLIWVHFCRWHGNTAELWNFVYQQALQPSIARFSLRSTIRFILILSLNVLFELDEKELGYIHWTSKEYWMIQMSRISVIQHQNIYLLLFQKAQMVYSLHQRSSRTFKRLSQCLKLQVHRQGGEVWRNLVT